MEPTSYFAGAAFTGPGWLRWAMLAVIVLGIALGGVFFAARAEHDPKIYSPRLAWVRAWLYYCFVILFSWVSGALGYVLSNPLVPSSAVRVWRNLELKPVNRSRTHRQIISKTISTSSVRNNVSVLRNTIRINGI